MAWTVSASGSQTSTVGAEVTLTTDTNNGTFYFEADFTPMVAGDIVELRVYVMTLNGGTLHVAWKDTIGPILPVCPIRPSPPQPSDQSIRVTLRQTAGTARVFPWKLLRI
jgi:hypothetical protein